MKFFSNPLGYLFHTGVWSAGLHSEKAAKDKGIGNLLFLGMIIVVLGLLGLGRQCNSSRYKVVDLGKHEPEKKVTSILTEKRSGRDRRDMRWGDLIWLLKTGQRRRLRRMADRRTLRLLDYYSPKLFYAVVLVLLLSVIDALLTLWLIDHGANEVNPVMAYFLRFGPNVFMLAKYLLTSMAVIIVVLLNYGFIRYIKLPFRVLMQFFAGCFGMVVAWELFLIARLML